MWTAKYPVSNGRKCEKAWDCCASSADGLKLIAGVKDGRLYRSSDGGENWTETRPAGDVDILWTCCALSADGLKAIVGAAGAGRLYVSSNGGATWTETQPAGDITTQWNACDISSDGMTMIVCRKDVSAYVSFNGGVIWAEIQPEGDHYTEWLNCACSGNGAILLLLKNQYYSVQGYFREHLFLSTDGGVTWKDQVINNIAFCASSSDGLKIFVGENPGRLYISSDGGNAWYESWPKGDADGLWDCCALSGDGLKAIVSENPGRLYISSDGGATWAETRPVGDVDGSWTGCALSTDGTKAIVTNKSLRAYRSVDGGNTWTETQPKGDLNGEWTGCALNSDGLKGIIGEDPGRVYLTSDGGDTWSETQPVGDVDENWACYALSANGLKMIAGADYGRIHISSNGGDTWADITGADGYWRVCAISSDGSRGIIGMNNGRLYLSTDGGENWSQTQPAGDTNRHWACCDMNIDGLKIIVGENPGRLYISSDGGETWNKKTMEALRFCDVSADGSMMITGGGIDTHGEIYHSSDGGVTWIERTLGKSGDWNCCALSQAGLRIIVGGHPGVVYASIDGGATWVERQIAGPPNRYWSGFACSADGMKMIAAEGVGGREGWVWTSSDGGECPNLSTPYRPLIGGISGHANEGDVAGTLGMIVRDKTDRKLVMLTNNHCAGTLYDENYEKPDVGSLYTTGIEMMQPSPYDGGIAKDVFGQVKRAVPIQFGLTSDQDNHVDAAIATIEINDANTPINFLDVGPFDSMESVNIDERVFVVGRTEGLVVGSQAYVKEKHYGLTITYHGLGGDNCKAVFTDQIVISVTGDMGALFKPGSSGSMVLVRYAYGYRVIGILFAANSSYSAGIVCPIKDVLELLDVEMWDGSIVVPSNLNAQIEVQDRTYTRVGGTPEEVTHTIG